MLKTNILLRYSLLDLFYLSRCLLYTKLFFNNARLVRLPIDIRGKRNIVIGKGFTTGKHCRLEVLAEKGDTSLKLQIGKNVQINDNVHIAASNSVLIGDNVLVASKVFISDHNHGNYSDETIAHDSPLSTPISRPLYSKPVVLEDNVWVGEFVAILPGVTIGKGSIIGSMSVVSKDIPPFSIAVGSPAKVIKKFNFETNKWEKQQSQ